MTDEVVSVLRAALMSEDEIAHGEAVFEVDGRLVLTGECAYDNEPWPCRTQRGVDRALARLQPVRDSAWNVDPELRKRVEQIKSSPVQLYREAGDYSNRELVEGIVVSPDDIAAIEAVASEGQRAARAAIANRLSEERLLSPAEDDGWCTGYKDGLEFALDATESVEAAEAAHHRMVQPDHYQRWER